ncbi:MAG TPA: right-handed parallel beta-helix repeat-containing protein, partial [Verrucomicrobiae bacterium]|nr:right-handed parallel beta-helix repeat-containing protein [Verrucomicrobiae bacterium]
QAAIGVPAAVSLAHAASWRIESCRFQSLGGYALELGQGCQSNLVAACEFSDLGAGGIKIGETSIRRHRAGQAFGNTVMNCTLRDGGKLFASAVGIWIGQSFSNKLLRNTIRDFYYTGISIGWSWGYGQALASNNLIAFNRVGYIGEKSDHDGPVLSDMGGIYTLGRQPGTRILNNVFHDISGIRYGGWGIYLDEGSSGIIVQSNIVRRTTHGGFHQHYGETNRIENNIFALGRDQQLQLSVAEAHQSLRFRHNIVYFNHGALLAGAWRKAQVDMDENLYYDTRGSNAFDFAGLPFEKWRQLGRDEHSLIADPQFANPANEDFTPAAGSPAGRIGFQEITAPAGNTKKSEQHLRR